MLKRCVSPFGNVAPLFRASWHFEWKTLKRKEREQASQSVCVCVCVCVCEVKLIIVCWRIVNPGGASSGEEGSETADAGAPSTLHVKHCAGGAHAETCKLFLCSVRELWRLRLSHIRLITFTCRNTHARVTYTHTYTGYARTYTHICTQTHSNHSNVDLN